MSEHTHCDRCGAVGRHKGDSTTTREFPVIIKLRKDIPSVVTRTRTRELCQSCGVELALFLGDEDLAEKVAPEDEEVDR